MEETLVFEAFPDAPLVVVRLKNVKNATRVREAIVGKTLKHDAAFIDAQTIPDIIPTTSCCLQSAISGGPESVQKLGKQVTHSLHADIVYNVSGSRHIASALNTFGINKDTTDVLIARFAAKEEEMKALVEAVEGDQVAVLEGGFADTAAARKLFKCGDAELKIGTIMDAAACKGALLQC